MAGPPPTPTILFISPNGRPFRAKLGEPYPVGAWFALADTDKDGRLTPAEMRGEAAIFFRALDQDRNGLVENMEIIFYERRIAPEILQEQKIGALEASSLLIRAQYGGQQQSRSGGEAESRLQRKPPKDPFKGINMQGAARYNMLREPQPVASSDSDFNRRITPQEFAAASDRRFKLLDRDGDGFLTLATLPETYEQNRAARGGRGKPPPGA